MADIAAMDQTNLACQAGKGIGVDIVEVAPSRDIDEIPSITAGHPIFIIIGTAVRAGDRARQPDF